MGPLFVVQPYPPPALCARSLAHRRGLLGNGSVDSQAGGRTPMPPFAAPTYSEPITESGTWYGFLLR